MKKRIILIILIAGVSFFCCNDGYSEETKIKAESLMSVVEKVGKDDAYIGPMYFPDFYKFTNVPSSETATKDAIENLSNKKLSSKVNENGFLKTKGGFLASKNCDGACQRTESGKCEKVACSGGEGIDVKGSIIEMEGNDVTCDDDFFRDLPFKIKGSSDDYYTVKITAGYEEVSKLLFSWSVRVEGYKPVDIDHGRGKKISGIAIWPVLAHPWHGTSYQDYTGGQVRVQLYIRDAEEDEAKRLSVVNPDGEDVEDSDGFMSVGVPIEMTVPPVGSGTVKVGTGSDPTLIGSYVVTKDNFKDASGSNKLPNKIRYKLKWANHTALRIKSPAKQRNIVVTKIPVTEVED